MDQLQRKMKELLLEYAPSEVFYAIMQVSLEFARKNRKLDTPNGKRASVFWDEVARLSNSVMNKLV